MSGIKTIQLIDHLEIINGYSFRVGLDSFKVGNTPVLSTKNILDNGKVETQNLPKIDLEPASQKSFTKKNDVILSNRGNFKAGVVEATEPLLINTTLFILRIKNQTILPQYLALFLNSQVFQNKIQKHLRMAIIPTLTRKYLDEIKIPVPDIQSQQKCIDFYTTINQEIELIETKKTILQKIQQTIINKLLTI
jgi:restriction endonuclease S subunit